MKKSYVFSWIGIALIVASLIFFYKGYDKTNNYRNSDSIYSENVNAYVGGDAYNYIINAEYANGNFIIAIGLDIIATILIVSEKISNDIKGNFGNDFNMVSDTKNMNDEELPKL